MRRRPNSIGVRVMGAKRLVFTLAAFGAALAGALWVATALTFQPKAYFSPLWTAYMIFMALVGDWGHSRARSSAQSSSSPSRPGSATWASGILSASARPRSFLRSSSRAVSGAGSRTTRR